MEFEIMKASDLGYEESREINTVEDLKKLAKEHPKKTGAPEDLVVLFDGWGSPGVPTIVIYDDYIE